MYTDFKTSAKQNNVKSVISYDLHLFFLERHACNIATKGLDEGNSMATDCRS